MGADNLWHHCLNLDNTFFSNRGIVIIWQFKLGYNEPFWNRAVALCLTRLQSVRKIQRIWNIDSGPMANTPGSIVTDLQVYVSRQLGLMVVVLFVKLQCYKRDGEGFMNSSFYYVENNASSWNNIHSENKQWPDLSTQIIKLYKVPLVCIMKVWWHILNASCLGLDHTPPGQIIAEDQYHPHLVYPSIMN